MPKFMEDISEKCNRYKRNYNFPVNPTFLLITVYFLAKSHIHFQSLISLNAIFNISSFVSFHKLWFYDLKESAFCYLLISSKARNAVA